MERPENFLIKSLFVCCCSEARHKARPIFHYCMTWGEALWSVSCEPALPVPWKLGWLKKQTLTINQVEQRLGPGAGVRPNFEPNKSYSRAGLTQWDYCQDRALVILSWAEQVISFNPDELKSSWANSSYLISVKILSRELKFIEFQLVCWTRAESIKFPMFVTTCFPTFRILTLLGNDWG